MQPSTPHKKSRRVSNFLAALRTDGTQQPILVLGEPGSGKSVALRSLCRLLLQETPKNYRLPLYVNLKNWKPEATWSESCPPTTKDLQQYVKNYVVLQSDDVFADRFLTNNFEIMLKNGIVFFIFDSFDEIPAVMDAQEGSWIIAALSNVVGNFLHGAHASRGIVASRYFKRPTEHLGASSVYRIKPFDDTRIRRLLRQVGGRSAQDIKAIFASKPDLVSMAKNPMVASLLATFVYEHGGTLPDSKLALFHDYVERRISDAGVQERLAQSGIDSTQLVAAAVVLATKIMDNPGYGLEAPLSALQDEAPGLPLIEGAKILRFARLARGGSDARQSFSFVHRRFQEYFAVIGLMQAERSLGLESIGRDARYRDTLALYAEIAQEGVANEMVSHCWEAMKHLRDRGVDLSSAEALRGVQCLRFLCEAFRSRRDFTPRFLQELSSFIERALAGSHHPLVAKFAAEAIALLDEGRAADRFIDALAYRSTLIAETAFRACRHLVQISEPMRDASVDLIKYYRYCDYFGFELWRRRRDLTFSVSISDGFGDVKRMTHQLHKYPRGSSGKGVEQRVLVIGCGCTGHHRW